MNESSSLKIGYFLSQNLSANLGTKNTRVSKTNGNSLSNLKSDKKNGTQNIQVLGQKIPKIRCWIISRLRHVFLIGKRFKPFLEWPAVKYGIIQYACRSSTASNKSIIFVAKLKSFWVICTFWEKKYDTRLADPNLMGFFLHRLQK